ncbi:hypothetical protein D7Y13_22375 [Corallococcus praedator]|uniref:Cyclophilin-like domain-containing protein n=2 Tax=Myxococcaceae TaxID=31 RepID=A0ABX9QE25_9BACT|nr:hypothetical protein D7X75_29220 [Corallococcus sp. CA031C]RKI03288.1 hypothetical protein D7Y13_22375 [Corallococcus praedator]
MTLHRTRPLALGLSLSLLLAGCACANNSDPRHGGPASPTAPSTDGGGSHAPPGEASAQMKITVGTAVFTATLHDNETARTFKKMLPLTLNMKDLNSNEKYHRFPDSLPAKDANPGKIQAGDVMLYGSNTLVLFYESFSTSYRYTRIAEVDDPIGLAAALGSGDVSVTFGL